MYELEAQVDPRRNGRAIHCDVSIEPLRPPVGPTTGVEMGHTMRQLIVERWDEGRQETFEEWCAGIEAASLERLRATIAQITGMPTAGAPIPE